jgi:oxaloacetate decarboxylase beta subunit
VVAPLITMLMFCNLLKEVGVTDRLAKTAAGGLMNVIILILTVARHRDLGRDHASLDW